jgi:hypothetical protein
LARRGGPADRLRARPGRRAAAENLSAEEIAIVVPIVSEGAKLFDYELPD